MRFALAELARIVLRSGGAGFTRPTYFNVLMQELFKSQYFIVRI
jgi:hypothetical protein